MRRLPGVQPGREWSLPRGFRDHQQGEGRDYLLFLRSLQERFGAPFPKGLDAYLREAGRMQVELNRINDDKERARSRRRLTEERRLARRQSGIRRDFMKAMGYIDSVMASQPRTHRL